jgi:hypothetical protein
MQHSNSKASERRVPGVIMDRVTFIPCLVFEVNLYHYLLLVYLFHLCLKVILMYVGLRSTVLSVLFAAGVLYTRKSGFR